MISKILYATNDQATAETINRRFPREKIRACPLISLTGLRGEIVVVQPPSSDFSPRELEIYKKYFEIADHKRRDLDIPLIMGEIMG